MKSRNLLDRAQKTVIVQGFSKKHKYIRVRTVAFRRSEVFRFLFAKGKGCRVLLAFINQQLEASTFTKASWCIYTNLITMSLDTYFILEEFEQKINSEFQEFLKTFDAEHASLYPTPKMSSDLSKGDFSVMLKGVASKLYEVPASELEGLSAKDQKNKKAQLQNQFADTFSANITARLSEFAVRFNFIYKYSPRTQHLIICAFIERKEGSDSTC
jgi:hypothetical protein